MSDDLAARVQCLEDERDILRTIYQYAQSQGTGDRATFLDLWVEDAYYVRVRHNDTLQGHEAIAGFYDRITHAPEAWHKHVVIEPLIEIDGDRATVIADFLYVQLREEGPLISHFGHYEDVLVRCPDGRWRFQRRELHTEAFNPGSISTVKGDPGFYVPKPT